MWYVYNKYQWISGLSKHSIGEGGRGRIAQWFAYLLPDSAALASIPSIPPKKIQGKNADVAEVDRRGCLEESRQWLEKVDLTYLVLASGIPVLQKNFILWQSSLKKTFKIMPKSYHRHETDFPRNLAALRKNLEWCLKKRSARFQIKNVFLIFAAFVAAVKMLILRILLE